MPVTRPRSLPALAFAVGALASGAAFAQSAAPPTGQSGPTGASAAAGAGMRAPPSAATPPSTSPPVNGPTTMPSAGSMSSGTMSTGAMSPGTSMSTTARVASNPSANIIAVLTASGQFTTLLKALTATNLTSTVQTATPLTLFAPTDAAFAALPPGVVAGLMQPTSAAQLQKVLTYHLIHSSLPSSKIKGHSKSAVPTVEGQSLQIDGSGPAVTVNGGALAQADVMASNGVIHVVNQVLLPPGFAPPMAAAPTGATRTTSTTSTTTTATPAGQ